MAKKDKAETSKPRMSATSVFYLDQPVTHKMLCVGGVVVGILLWRDTQVRVAVQWFDGENRLQTEYFYENELEAS